MFEKYQKYKLNYSDYLLLFKLGNFYLSLNDDAIILNRVMNYSIVDNNKYLKVGFPINSIKKVEANLNANNINYGIITDNIIKHRFCHNTYSNYQSIISNYYTIHNRIKHINNLLNERISYTNIDKLLTNIESIIYEG